MTASKQTTNVDVAIIGAGAAGLMCAIEAGKRGRTVVVLERNAKIGEKIRISGGGRCNFTNDSADYTNFISKNLHFCKSAFARFTPQDFVALVERQGIRYHEKTLGQLFCDESAQQIIDMLQRLCDEHAVELCLQTSVERLTRGDRFLVETNSRTFISESLVIATGGRSIPKLGASDFGYRVAQQFGLRVLEPKPGLVPLTFGKEDREQFSDLSGISIDATVRCNGGQFRENILFTHRGLSGPAILQISSYWHDGDEIEINLVPDHNLQTLFKEFHQTNMPLAHVLERNLPKRFVQKLCRLFVKSKPMCQYSNNDLKTIADQLHHWVIVPEGTEGFEKAEVTVGGVDTAELSSKTMEAKNVPGLYFIGEVVDVTGWLGGYNFQWAWSSGFVAGQYV